MRFRQIYDGASAQAADLIGCQKTEDAIVVDPARDIDRYLEVAIGHGNVAGGYDAWKPQERNPRRAAVTE